MKGQAKLKRYLLLLRKIRTGQYPSLETLKKQLKFEDFGEISTRSLRRDFEALRNEYEVEITYDSKRNGYYILEDESGEKYHYLLQFLETAYAAETLQSLFKADHDVTAFISLDSSTHALGIEHVEQLLRYIKSKHKIQLQYQRFLHAEIKTYDLEPYHLKSYRGCWYLIAYSIDHREIRTFGLDRIVSIEANLFFDIPSIHFNPKAYFSDVLGITVKDIQAEIIRFWVAPTLAPYLKSNPVHESQILVSEDALGCIFQLKLAFNIELKTWILGYGAQIKILSPNHLKEKIREEIEIAREMYL